MTEKKLFAAGKIGSVETANRIVMAPMTRSRAIGNVPNGLMAKYYGQRSGAGMIVTEGTSPSPNGLGYPRIPGIYSAEQTEGWKKITAEVHTHGSKIFVQLMHTGRIGHSLNLPKNAEVLAPSTVKPAGQMWTDQAQLQDYPVPKAMSLEQVEIALQEFVEAAKNAMAANFDGVELHGANGYLLEQFLSPVSNRRTDEYGGSVEKRCKFVVEVATRVAKAIGNEKLGIRLSPYGVASDMPHYSEIDATYQYLAGKLNQIGIAYIHIVDHSPMGAPEVPLAIKKLIRGTFKNTIILAGGYDRERAEADLQKGLGDFVAFGRPFINNPDLVERFKNDWPLSNDLNTDLFYSDSKAGYTDYPDYRE